MDRPDYKEEYKYKREDDYKYTRVDDFKYDYKSGIKWFREDKYGNKYNA